MIYSISGKLVLKNSDFSVVETGGIGYKIFLSERAVKELPKVGSKIKLFCFHRAVDGQSPELFGFLTEAEIEIFEQLISVSGIGPKSALGILGAIKKEKLLAAIRHNRADILSKSWGIGRKKAERIVMELKDKIKAFGIKDDVSLIEADTDLKSALKNLGYDQKEVERALEKISDKIRKTEERLKEALKFLNQR